MAIDAGPAVIELGLAPKFGDIDAEVLNELMDGVVELPVFEIMSAANRQLHAAALVELIALCMATKVVVIVEDQNFLVLPELALVVVGSCKAGNTAADDHKVKGLLNSVWQLVANAITGVSVGRFIRSWVRPAQTGANRWIIESGFGYGCRLTV